MERPGHYEQHGDVQEWVWDDEPAPAPEPEEKPKRSVKKVTKEKDG